MICPRCSVGEISEATQECLVCGFSRTGGVAVETSSEWNRVEDPLLPALERQFAVEGVLRRGSTSRIYLARDQVTGRLCSLKVLPLGEDVPEGLIERFRKDAQRAATLDHPHLVSLLSYGATDEAVWYALEYVQGRSHGDLLRAGDRMDLKTCLRRPEQFGPSGRLSPAVDQYALAVLAFYCLARRPPIVGDTLDEITRHHLEGPVPLIAESRPDLPAYVSSALARAMSRAPADRFPGVLDFVTAMSGVPAAEPVPAPAPAAETAPEPVAAAAAEPEANSEPSPEPKLEPVPAVASEPPTPPAAETSPPTSSTAAQPASTSQPDAERKPAP